MNSQLRQAPLPLQSPALPPCRTQFIVEPRSIRADGDANMFISVSFLKEKLRPEDFFGCTYAVIGAFLLVVFSHTDEKIFTAKDLVSALTEMPFIIYIALEIVGIIALLTMKYRWHIENILILLLISDLLASFTVIAAKGISGMIGLTFMGHMQLTHPVFWIMIGVMICSCIIQVKFLNEAMQLFDAKIVVPTNFVFFTISAIIAGIVFYKEFGGMSALDIFMFLLGCIMCFVGVYFFTVGKAEIGASSKIVAALKKDGVLKYVPYWLVDRPASEINSSMSNDASAEDLVIEPLASPHHNDTINLINEANKSNMEIHGADNLNNIDNPPPKNYGAIHSEL